MKIKLLKSKIHRATVTEADLHYVGSITIDEELMEASGIIEYEKVHILDITNGSRLDTYAIKGLRGSGCIKINGAAAHHVNVNDLIIIVSYGQLENHEIKSHKPQIVHVNSQNKITSIYHDEFSV